VISFMGYELWTSPITGYRRKGTRLSELRAALDGVITTRTIFEPLQCCPSLAPAEKMKTVLEQRGFDIAGVQDFEGGPVVGFIIADSLDGGVIRDYTKPVAGAEPHISDVAPLSELLAVLDLEEWAFVRIGGEVKGIVTLADLNKPPVRVYLFGLISLLDMHLRFWVRRYYDGDSWKGGLTKKRLKAASDLQRKRLARKEEIGLLDCLQFCDKRDLLVANDDLRKSLGLGNKKEAGKLLVKAEDLRNRLAHSQLDLVQGTSWQVQIKTIQKIEAVVHRSDEAVEQMAKHSAQGLGSLWISS
jgi:hypothetical protein